AVKVTPAHDPNDFEIGNRHDLPFITARGLIPPGLVPVPARAGLPELGGVDFVLLHGNRRGVAQEAADALASAILAGGDRLHRGTGGTEGP
ncbi:hypothetical protein LCE32_21835, partial [Streptomyces sp. 7G]|nr:hypothetical protein [Streptomyces sp. 7G]